MSPSIATPDVPEGTRAPYVDGAKVLIDGQVLPWEGACSDVVSPIFAADGSRFVIGRQAVFTPEASVAAVEAAACSWARGRGTWALKTLEERISSVEQLVERLQERRAEIIEVLQWEICKNDADAAKEFDRTMEFIAALIAAARDMNGKGMESEEGVHAIVKRS